MRFETKTAIAIREDLPAWQKLNMTAFLASGIAATVDGIVGLPYEDAGGNRYLPMFRQPVMVFAGDGDALRTARARAMERGLRVGVFTSELFQTGHDGDNRAAVRAVAADALDLTGIALHGPRKDVDKALKGLSLHR